MQTDRNSAVFPLSTSPGIPCNSNQHCLCFPENSNISLLNKAPSPHLTGQLTTLCINRDKNFSALESVSSAQASVQELLLLLAQQQWVSYLHGFLVGQQGCENLSLAVPSQTDGGNIASSRHQTASWSPQRHSPAQPRERGNQNYSLNKHFLSCIIKLWGIK